MLQTRTQRKIAAIFFSGFLQVGLVLVSMALVASRIMSPFRDQGFEGLLIFVISIVGSSVILGRDTADRFWRTYLFSAFAGLLPFNVFFVVEAIRSGTEGYWGLGLIVMNFLLAVASIVALPFVALFYFARTRTDSHGTAKLIRRREPKHHAR